MESIRFETENFINEHVENGAEVEKFLIGLPRRKFPDLDRLVDLIASNAARSL